MQQRKNIETLEQYRDRYSPYVPGLSVEEVRRREKALPGLVAEQRAIQDPKGVGTKRQESVKPPSDADEARDFLKGPAKSPPAADMVTIRNAKTGETKRVTRAEAQALGAL
jgi:hypothetical protein